MDSCKTISSIQQELYAFDLSVTITLDTASKKMQLSTVEQFRNVVYEQICYFSMWGVSAY